MVRWTDNINGEPDTPRGVSPVRGRVLGDPAVVIQKGAGCLAYIVSTIIKENGEPINTHYIGKNVSKPASRRLEDEFGLVKAENRKQKEHFELKPVDTVKVQYGRSETKRAITNVLGTVLPYYNYTSLAELNAVLRHYNVVADQGSEKSRMYKNNGLVYRALDEQGKMVGVPIKASDLYLKPTMKYLQKRFDKNALLRAPLKQRIKNAIDLALMKTAVTTVEDLQAVLKKENIQLLIRHNKDGSVGGLTFVDHKKKAVFNGSDLHEKYSAASIHEQLRAKTQKQNETQTLQQKQRPAQTVQKQDQTLKPAQQPKMQPRLPAKEKELPSKQGEKEAMLPSTGRGPLEVLLQPESGADQVPYDQPQQKKKRKKKRLHL
ncbi:relaxase [Longitalea arenae]|uniref:relaxase n=1 Tax=Longitalea arenae TaxID=2812558 RepID=UPI00196849E9|nr:relaxase [Longitalea arenae]